MTFIFPSEAYMEINPAINLEGSTSIGLSHNAFPSGGELRHFYNIDFRFGTKMICWTFKTKEERNAEYLRIAQMLSPLFIIPRDKVLL